MKERKQFSSCGSVHDRLSRLSPKYQWFVAQSAADEDGNGDQFFYNIQDPLSFYQFQIPELHKKRIRGSFHGWLILSNDSGMWSLWNPVTSKIMHLPRLVLEDGDFTYIKECCLSLPPDDPNSILLLTRRDKPNFVFCLLNRRRKRLRWTEISYAKQLKRISGKYGRLVHSLCCCNGKVYALNTDSYIYAFVIEIGIVVKDGGVAIKLMLFSGRPDIPYCRGDELMIFLIGSDTELFCIIIVNFNDIIDTPFSLISLHKLDMTNIDWEKLEGLKKWDIITGRRPEIAVEEEEIDNILKSSEIWEQMKDLKDGNIYVDLARDNLVAYSPTIASEFGGNILIRSRLGKVISSYNLSDRTISLSSMFPSPVLPTSHVSVWECRLAADNAKAQQEVEDKDRGIVVRLVNDDDELDESPLLNLPLGVLEMIMELCIGLEYLNFRATCKRCHLAAPVVQWGGELALKRLQNYFLLSPWLMMADEKQGNIIFEDPLYGYKYFTKKLRVSVDNNIICYSGYGWLLYYSDCGLEFCNPFTDEVHDLPKTDKYFYSLCCSAPPTSPDCMVFGFCMEGIYIHFVHGEQTWRLVRSLVSLDNDDDDDDDDDDEDEDEYEDDVAFYFPTFYGRDLYALCVDGTLHVFKNLGQEDYSWIQDVVVKAPRRCLRSYPVEFFLTKCDQHVLLVFVDLFNFGKYIEVFKLNDLTEEWEETYSLGRHTIYISDSACLCIEAKTPEMEDKIFFARFYNKNGKVVFYSLETGMYHTFDAKNIEESFGDFFGTKYPLYAHAWIEPTWGAIKPFAV